jgi:hypothetical protein
MPKLFGLGVFMVTAEKDSKIFSVVFSLSRVVAVAVVPLRSPIYPVGHQKHQNFCF